MSVSEVDLKGKNRRGETCFRWKYRSFNQMSRHMPGPPWTSEPGQLDERHVLGGNAYTEPSP